MIKLSQVKSWLFTNARRPSFWFIIAITVLITIPHYQELINYPSFITDLTSILGLQRHALERILYVAPIAWSSILFGRKGAFVFSIIALACMLPRAVLISPQPADAIFESCAVCIVGNVLAITIDSLRRERKRRTHLDALNQTSTALSQSLDLEEILRSSIDRVVEVMNVDAAMVFLLNSDTGELFIAAYHGVSAEFVNEFRTCRLGGGFNGRVAQSGEPMYLEDVSKELHSRKSLLEHEGIKSQLIVPLKSKGKVLGTLSIIARVKRQFQPEEVELVTAIGNQIGVAIENANLYKQERDLISSIRASEERYRELFENAYDSIWLHDLEDNIIAANRSFVRLTGYGLDELDRIKANDLIAEGQVRVVKDIEERQSKDEATGSLAELVLIRKDKTEASIQLSTNPVYKDGKIVAFQHIARDVTEEKRMKENLRYYLGQVTKAQEEERKRISRELHDDTIQSLVVLSRQLDDIMSKSKGLSEEQRVVLEDLWQQTNNIMNGVRRLSHDLRPPTLDRLGLLPALEWLASDTSKNSAVDVQVRVQGAPRRFSSDVDLLLFRIVQEALRNVWRHSQATTAEVIVDFDEGKTTITVVDNGKGFGFSGSMSDLTSSGKLGLAGIQERARLMGGSVRVVSEPGKGTTVVVEAPI